MSRIPDEFLTSVKELKEELKANLLTCQRMASEDLLIDEIDLDSSLLEVPKLFSKWSAMLSDETIKLKDLYGFKESVKLERWKYYSGKQTDEYISKHGILHEKILKTDIDRYLSCDEKLTIVNDLCTIQKEVVDTIERTLKEISSRNFHIKAIIDWRKFTSGG